MTEKLITAVGERIKSTRRQLGYSRRAFEEIFGIPAATLQAWEDGKYEVSTKGICRYIDALQKAGLATSQDWFLSGSGMPPRPIGDKVTDTALQALLNEGPLSEDEIILREVTYFESINKNPMIIVISDDTMKPIFDVGDYVGGNLVLGEYASKYIGTFCIVRLDSGETFVRKIKHGSKHGLFNLISINLDTHSEHPFLLDRKINQLAQVVWHRKTEHIV